MSDEKLYVVTDGPPGPGAPSGEQRRDLIARLRTQAVAVAQGAQVDATSVELLREAASAIEAIHAQFVELETEGGESVGPSSGVGWRAHPRQLLREGPGEGMLYRLGPFMAYRPLSASEALVRAAKAVDAMFNPDLPFTFADADLPTVAEEALLVLHDCLNDLERVRELAEATRTARREERARVWGSDVLGDVDPRSPEAQAIATVVLAQEVRALRLVAEETREVLQDGLGQR